MTVTHVLPDRLDAQAVGPLRDALMAASEDVDLDAGHVTMIGTLGAQVLLAARMSFETRGLALRLSAQSADFTACISDLGLTSDQFETKEAA